MLNLIHPAGAVFSRICLRSIRGKTPATVRPKPNTVRYVRFDDAATAATSAGFSETWLKANVDAKKEWKVPNTKQILDAIHRELENYPTTNFKNLRDRAERTGLRLVCGVLEKIDPCTSEITPAAGYFEGEPVVYSPLKLIESTAVDATLLLTAHNSRVGLRKCSVPNNGVVGGPYLFVGAIDQLTGLSVRARIFPIHMGENTFRLARSSYERIAFGIFDQLSIPFCVPVRKVDLATLQSGLGARFAGELTAYPYLPDAVLLPSDHKDPIGIFELFGLCRFKRYSEAKYKKENELSRGRDLRQFWPVTAAPLRGTQNNIRADLQDQIHAALKAWAAGDWK